MTDDFFPGLRKKLLRQPDRNFDERFWTKFDNEFGQPRDWKTMLRRLSVKPFQVLVPAAALSLAIAVTGIFVLHAQRERARTEIAVQTQAEQILSNEEIISNLDLLTEFEDLPASDAEWEILLSPVERGSHDET